MPDWLQETHGKTVFEGDVLRLVEPAEVSRGARGSGVEYDVQRGGWSYDRGPDTWLRIDVLGRFQARRVRITIEDLGPSPLMPHAAPRT